MDFRKGRPLASMSMQMALAPLDLAWSIFSKTSSLCQGLTVGTEKPDFSRAAQPALKKSRFRPSPVKAAMPASRQPLARVSV